MSTNGGNMKDKTLVGTWNLNSFHLVDSDGNRQAILGENPKGRINYSKGGYFSAHIMGENRPTSGFPLHTLASDEEKIAGFDSYTGYCGKYHYTEGQVIHHVEIGHYQDWVGSDQVRYVEWNGDILILSTPKFETPEGDVVFTISWERVE